MTDQLFINELLELEALADLLEGKAHQLKESCRRTKAKLEGVSTPSRRKAKGLDEKQLAQLISKRRKHILKTINKKAANGLAAHS